MARPAPGAHRSVAVLEFLSQHPDDRYTLSEVARQCGFNKATAHALLTALNDHGVILRHPDEKRYSLGPKLVALGQAAQRGYRPADFASGTLDRLARSTGFTASATILEDDHVVMFAVTTSGDERRQPSRVRLPLVAPLGAVFVAWSGSASIEAWLARAHSDAAVRVGLSIVDAVRRDGFMVARATPAWSTLVAVADGGLGSPAVSARQHHRMRQAMGELAADEPFVTAVEPRITCAVDHLTVPVFDSTGSVNLAVALSGLGDGPRGGAEILELVAAVAGAAESLTSAVHGQRPSAV